MSPPSQYQARRLLELVSHNKARFNQTDHVDSDVWARTHPPVRGLNFRDRATARCCLRAGGLGAVPSSPPELPDVHSRPLSPAPSHQQQQQQKQQQQQNMPRAESNQSKITVSSVPSFGKMQEPLSGDSVNLDLRRARPALVTEYEEFGSEALITQVYDEIDEEFDDSSPSRLFSEIGPSISVAKGIDANKHQQPTHYHPDQLEMGLNDALVEPVSQDHDHPESTASARNTFTSTPSTTTTLPPPPLPPLPAYALEPENQLQNKPLRKEKPPGAMPVPPPPPPLYTVQSYGSTPAVPPPPSSPPPSADDKRSRRDTEESSPITEGESYGYKGEVRDEFSDLADSSVPSMKGHWFREYGPAGSEIEKDEEEEDYEDGRRQAMVDLT